MRACTRTSSRCSPAGCDFFPPHRPPRTPRASASGCAPPTSPSTCAAGAPFLAIQLPTLDILKSLAAERGVKVDTTFLLCGGAFAGGLAQTVVYPLDLLRRRLQVGGQAAEGVVSDSTWLSIRSIVRREGLRGLFAGIGPTYLKVMPATATGMTTAASIVGYYQSQQERR